MARSEAAAERAAAEMARSEAAAEAA